MHFDQTWIAVLVLVVLMAIAGLMLLARGLRTQKAGRTHVALPAVLPVMRSSSRFSVLRHAAFLVFLLGVPFFAVALADPHTAFTREETSYPGRRIALLVDGSSSMVMKFETKSLKTPENRAFYTAVAAAEHFMKLRMNGRYHDLIALIQFGNEAYVVTPFTTDYENIMLSIRLISSPKEWGSFNDWGTTIMQGLNQATQLFRAFDFVNAAGNAMLMFTDGRDDEKDLKGKSIQSVIDDMKKYKIPVYMIRTGFDLQGRPDSARTSCGRRSSSRPADASTPPTAKTRSSRPKPRSTSCRPDASTSANTRRSARGLTATRSSRSRSG